MLTAWDGWFRVDNPGDRLQVTMLTIERTVTSTLRPGLSASFVADDPTGPPVFVALDIEDGLTADAAVLLGPRLAEAAAGVLAGPSRVRSGRLDLAQLSDLADTWAPYRARALAPPEQAAGERTAVGTWASGLWTRLGGEALWDALQTMVTPTPAFRDSGTTGEQDWHRWPLPAELADAARISPWLDWTVFDDELGRELVVRAEALDETTEGLWVAFDDRDSAWVPLERDHGEPRVLVAALQLAEGETPGLKIRTVHDA